jgi:hypothetical protein
MTSSCRRFTQPAHVASRNCSGKLSTMTRVYPTGPDVSWFEQSGGILGQYGIVDRPNGCHVYRN